KNRLHRRKLATGGITNLPEITLAIHRDGPSGKQVVAHRRTMISPVLSGGGAMPEELDDPEQVIQSAEHPQDSACGLAGRGRLSGRNAGSSTRAPGRRAPA